MSVKVIKVSRTDFELEDGRTYPIIPPLKEDLTAEEFQEHYDRACNLIGSLRTSKGQSKDLAEVGQGEQDKNHTD